MKRQLNFWSKPNTAPEKDLVNTSLSIEDNQFTIRFGKPGSVKPITQIVFVLDEDKSFDLRRAFELSGCKVFQDEMDERIYFANIARQKEDVKRAENLGVTTCWSVIVYIICMIAGVYRFNLSVILTSCISLLIAISFGFWLRKYVYNETKTSNNT